MIAAVSRQQGAGGVVTGVDGEHLGGAERGERHRPGPRRALLSAPPEVRHGALAHRLVGSAPRRGAERPHAPSPAILDAAPARPSSTGRAPVAHPPAHALGIGDESERHATEVDGDGSGLRLAGDGDEQPCHVVGAVALVAPGRGVVGVLERADVVAHRGQVIERREWGDHASTRSWDASSRAASRS